VSLPYFSLFTVADNNAVDRKIEFSLPDLDGRANILRIHAKSMSVDRDIRWELISRLCPNATGAELRSVATEAGMFAIRARRKVATEKVSPSTPPTCVFVH
jgi:26S proteasome regulatory subunit T1